MLTFHVENVQYLNGATGLKIAGDCLSTDERPTWIANGSRLYEIDTGDTYVYDEAAEEWVKQ